MEDFLSVYQKLRDSLPRRALVNTDSENSEYCNMATFNKNCYLCISSHHNQDCYYCHRTFKSISTVDSSFSYESELLYECVDCSKCHNCDFCQDCERCRDCFYCYECRGCSNCIGCVNLRNSEYYVFNKQIGKEKYQEYLKKLKEEKGSSILEKYERIKKQQPHQALHSLRTENCIGDYLYDSKNSLYCFDSINMEDCLYCSFVLGGLKDCVDCSFCYKNEECYELVSSHGMYNSFFIYHCQNSRDLTYCEYCYDCSNCFGCVYLQNKQYYILNQPYTKEEYHKKVKEIISDMKKEGTWGKHIPSTHPFGDSSYFVYNL